MEGMDLVVDAWYNEVTDPGFSADDINPYVYDDWNTYKIFTANVPDSHME